MDYQSELQEYLQIIIGKKLNVLNLACEMMMFSFGDYELHAQCFTRIIIDNEIITTTSDYQNWDGREACNNDEWYFIAKYKEQIIGGQVMSVEVNQVADVIICLDNKVQIQLFKTNGYSHFAEGCEQWVFFKRQDRSYPFITVRNKEIDITSS